ncbi:MAG: nucleotidyltransferase family protein [Nitrospirae bacterium]|nr:nucleotidyltransferase family protein [Nitrospirota bacterium]
MPQQVSAILLAAGSSKRMGQSKQLLLLKGKPVIRHCLDTLLSSEIRDIVVVLGSIEEEMKTTVDGLPVKVVFNTNPGSDMADSVRTGLRAVDGASTGILICLADQPLVTAGTIRMLVAHHNDGTGNILVPQFKTMNGHPVLFPEYLLKDIFHGGILRDIIKKYPGNISLLPVEDEGVILDLDTPEDYRNMREKTGS